jgi:hypothetical protein
VKDGPKKKNAGDCRLRPFDQTQGFRLCKSFRLRESFAAPGEAADALAPDLSLAMTPHFRYIYLTKMIIKYLYNGLPTAS